MAGDGGDELASVDHGPLNEGPWEKVSEFKKNPFEPPKDRIMVKKLDYVNNG